MMQSLTYFFNDIFSNSENRAWFILIICAFSFSLWRWASSSLVLTFIIKLPFVFCHEFLHFLVAFLMNAKPCSFTVWPKRVEGGIILGRVSVRNATFYNSAPTALAPLLLLGVSYFLWREFNTSISNNLIFVFFVMVQTLLISSAIPSIQDLKMMLYKGSIFFYAFLIPVVFYLCVALWN